MDRPCRLRRHPLVRRDILSIGAHIADASGDEAAAERRIREIEAGFEALVERPGSGTRLGGALAGYCVRHAGRDRRISIVFHHDPAGAVVSILLVAFGGQDWLGTAAARAPEPALNARLRPGSDESG